MPIEDALAESSKAMERKIKIALLERNMTQRELSRLIKENPQQVNRAIKGDTAPKSRKLRDKIYKVLNLKGMKQMQLTHDEKQEIAQMVVNLLDERKKIKVINPNWSRLSKEIEKYCKLQEESNNGSWYTLQSKIFGAIRAALNVSQVKFMTNEQVTEARKVFEFIKLEREIVNG